MNKLKGFTVIEVIIVLVVVGLLAFIGYTVYDNQVNRDTTESAIAEDVPATSEVPEVKDEGDVSKAEKFLSDIDLEDDSDLEQLEDELSNF